MPLSKNLLMISALITVMAFLSMPAHASGIIWENTYGGKGYDDVSSLQKTNGGFILVGTSTSFSKDDNYSIYVVNINDDGSLAWNRTYSDMQNSTGRFILPVSGGYLIAGREGTDSFPEGIAAILKIDDSGNVIWDKKYYTNNDTTSEFNCILPTEGGYIVAGDSIQRTAAPPLNNNLTIAKIFDNGSLAWSTKLPGVDQYLPISIQQTDDGFMLAGKCYSPYLENNTAFLARFNDSGDQKWLYKYEYGTNQTYFSSLQKTGEGNYLAVGGYTDNNGNNSGIFTAVVNGSGSVLPGYRIPQVKDGIASSVIIENDSAVIAGTVTAQNGINNLLLLKTWLNGSIITKKAIGGNGILNGYDLKPDGKGNYVVAGTAIIPSGENVSLENSTDIFVTKINLDSQTATPTITPTTGNGSGICGSLFILPLFGIFIALANRLKR